MPAQRIAMLPSLDLTRRRFLQGSAAAIGLLIGFDLPVGRAAVQADRTSDPKAFVRITPDNTVTVIAKHIEFGQGTHTGLATILVEELDADWSQVRVDSAPAIAALYKNSAFDAVRDTYGPVQGTGGSTAMADSWGQLRQAGARAKAMLVAAAAREWGVPTNDIVVHKGVLSHAGTGRRATFGELAVTAATVPPETVAPAADVKLKDSNNFTLIGKGFMPDDLPLPRLDSRAKTDGSAQFTLDVSLPGMLTALIRRPPLFGAKVKDFDASAARQVKGVTDVVSVPAGIAVLARSSWAAWKGRKALTITWDDSGAEKRGSDELFAAYRALAQQPGARPLWKDHPDAAIAGAARVFEAVYEFPYLAHAPMEPLDCVVRLAPDGCEVWAGSQLPTVDQREVAAAIGLPPEKVHIRTLLAGGSFGRRATREGVAGEAASIAKAIDGRQPVKLVWTREDDIQGGRYRPLYVHRLRAGLDPDGRIVGWEHRIVGQSILTGSPFEQVVESEHGIDPTSVEGANDLPYDIPHIGVELHTTQVGVPVLWWRSVGHTHTAFSTETFLDELAYAAGRNPLDLRRDLLKHHPRYLGVLELAAQQAGWRQPLPPGRARGVAVHKSFNTFVAQVAEVSLGPEGLPKVERVVCAIDCGIAINPDVIRAQMEGGIGYGLGAALWGEITLVQGHVQQANFHDYRPLRIEEMPQVEVHIVRSEADPTGVGEPGVPPIAPAVANALFHLTGRRVRRLPFAHTIA